MTDAAKQGKRQRVEVFCLTYGEPREPIFADQYEYSLNILNRLTRRVAPIPKFVTPLLAARRGRARVAGFTESGYRSPLEAVTEAQAAKIETRLTELDPSRDWKARMVMEFRPPFIWDHLNELKNHPPDELVILPLYMAESDFTAGISRKDLTEYDAEHKGHGFPKPAYVTGFGFDDRLGKVLANFIWDYCQKNGWSEEECRDAALVLGAHGTLQYPPEGINSGARETLYLFGRIRHHLKERFSTVRVGWLNHTLGGKWTFPAVDETAKEVQDQGIRNVVYFPFGFMGDNAESQVEGKEALEVFEWENLLYLPCPNDDKAFCDYLAMRVIERINDPMRENWDEIVRGGRTDLIQPERPAIRGEAGVLNFGSPILATLALLFWTLVGGMLTTRALLAARQIDSTATLAMVAALVLFIGIFKGRFVFGKMIKKNLKRLRGLPQPSPVWKLFPKVTYIVIAVMMGLGISIGLTLKYLGLVAAYSTILGGVGLAMLVGVLIGISRFTDCYPKRILSMDDESVQPRVIRSVQQRDGEFASS